MILALYPDYETIGCGDSIKKWKQSGIKIRITYCCSREIEVKCKIHEKEMHKVDDVNKIINLQLFSDNYKSLLKTVIKMGS